MKIIYLRTSTEEQNPKNQLRDCKQIVNGGYEVFEEKQSAYKNKERPVFEQVRNYIKSKKVSELIVWDLDRIYRNRKKLITFFQFCKFYDCKINSFRQQWLNELNNIPEPFNEMMHQLMLQIMGWLAEEESKKKSERVRIAYKNRSKKWGRRPLENVEDRVIKLYQEGKTRREIASLVHYWDNNRNKKYISKSAVHKIIKEFKGEKS